MPSDIICDKIQAFLTYAIVSFASLLFSSHGQGLIKIYSKDTCLLAHQTHRIVDLLVSQTWEFALIRYSDICTGGYL